MINFVAELFIMTLIFYSGYLIVKSTRVSGLHTLPASFIAGITALVFIGTLQIVVGLSTSPALTLALLLTCSTLLASFNPRLKGFKLIQPRELVLGLSIIFLSVFIFRYFNFVNWHTDSFFYIESAAMLNNESFSEVRFANIEKRVAAIPIIHSTSFLYGEHYLRSFAPLLSLSVLALLVWFYNEITRPNIKVDRRALFSILAVLLLITNSRYLFHSFYINGHLLFACFLLIVAGAGWILSTRRGEGNNQAFLELLLIMSLAALPLLRAEGAIMAALILLPTLLSPAIGSKQKFKLLFYPGLTTVAWQLFTISSHLAGGSNIPINVTGLAIFGAGLIASSIIFLKFDKKYLRKIWKQEKSLVILSEIGLYLVLLVFYVNRPEGLHRSIRSTIENTIFGSGSWGYSLLILGLIVLWLLFLRTFDKQVHLRFIITTFLPFAFILAYLHGGAYRVGNGDSLNRMLVHILPVTVLYVVIAISAGKKRFSKKDFAKANILKYKV